MPGKVIPVLGMNYGFAGTPAETPDSIIKPRAVAADSDPILFGEPVILNDDFTVSRFGSTGTAAKLAGIAARHAKTAASYTGQNDGGQYAPGDAASILERGPISVKCNAGTPTASAGVYVRVAANSSVPTGIVGGFEAAADGDNTIQLTNCKWGSSKDPNGIALLVITNAVMA